MQAIRLILLILLLTACAVGKNTTEKVPESLIHRLEARFERDSTYSFIVSRKYYGDLWDDTSQRKNLYTVMGRKGTYNNLMIESSYKTYWIRRDTVYLMLENDTTQVLIRKFALPSDVLSKQLNRYFILPQVQFYRIFSGKSELYAETEEHYIIETLKRYYASDTRDDYLKVRTWFKKSNLLLDSIYVEERKFGDLMEYEEFKLTYIPNFGREHYISNANTFNRATRVSNCWFDVVP